MKKKTVPILVLCSSLLLAACYQPIKYSAKDQSFTRLDIEKRNWNRIAVLPFSGEPAFRSVSAEWFAFQVRKHGLFELIDPGLAEIELKKKGVIIAEADIAIDDAREAGRLLGADAVVVGSLKGDPRQGPIAGASLVDVSTGKVVATSMRSAPFLFTHSMHERVMATTESMAEDVIGVLYELAGKTRPLPPKKTVPEQEPWRGP